MQKILLDKIGHWNKDWIVGKIAKKVNTGAEYIRRALAKLKARNDHCDIQVTL